MNSQAVFVLKGKPLNVWDLKRDVMYKNDEMYNLMQSINVEDNTEGLRYDKVILATDADGLHIRNLMITYFFKFFKQLVHDGHVYILETPLFRFRNKSETIYCYSEAERDVAVTKLGGKPEITRFKGLGEISPKEFQQFIGKEMRLSKVEYAPRAESGPICDFYMGKNTPERKDYIMDKLVVPVEENEALPFMAIFWRGRRSHRYRKMETETQKRRFQNLRLMSVRPTHSTIANRAGIGSESILLHK